MAEFREWFGRWASAGHWCDALYTAPTQQWTQIIREGLMPFTGELAVDVDADPHTLVRLEHEAMDRLTRGLHGARWVPFGPERVFAFLWELMIEAYNLKVALCGTLGRVAPQELRERLRYTYV